MIRPTVLPSVLVALLACLLAACGDKELEAKRERQAAEIKRLEAELAVARSKVGEPLPDHTRDLAKARKELESAKEAIVELENEVVSLNEAKKEAQRDFDAYRRKYRIEGAGN